MFYVFLKRIFRPILLGVNRSFKHEKFDEIQNYNRRVTMYGVVSCAL